MCFTCTRREFLKTGAAVVAATGTALAGGTAFSNPPLPSYCSLSGYPLHNIHTMASSGNRNLDRALIAELRRIISIIPVDPGFRYITDNPPNAFATVESMVRGTRGTVLLGVNLVREEIESSNYGGVAVAGICAHECAHIYQFFSGYARQLSGNTAKFVELHADFLAGYYMGVRRQFAIDRIAVFARSLFYKGDYNYNNPHHHGTPEARFEALRGGYEVGSNGVAFETAAAAGADFVLRL